jgi:chromosome partitioning protein
MTYDPGSSGALSYLSAAREVADRGAPAPVGAVLTNSTSMEESR